MGCTKARWGVLLPSKDFSSWGYSQPKKHKVLSTVHSMQQTPNKWQPWPTSPCLPKCLFMWHLKTRRHTGWSSFFMDSMSANSPTHWHLLAVPRLKLTVLSELFTDMHRAAKILNFLTPMFPAEAEQGEEALPSHFSSHTVNKCPFHHLFGAIFSAFLFLVILLFKMPPGAVLKCS